MRGILPRMLSGLAAVVMAIGLTVVGGHGAASAAESLACDPNGPTASDAAVGQHLNSVLSEDMDGSMGAYQTSCARVITQTIKSRGLPERAAVIAIATAIVETHLRNLNGGDRDSLGLFQQRAGWGTEAQRLNATWTTNRFINELLDLYPNNRWTSGPIGPICQGVQRSAYPDKYGRQVNDAYMIVDALWGAKASVERSGVAAVSRAAGQLDVFAKDEDNSFLHRHFNGETWSSWVDLGGEFRSNPAAYASAGRIDLVGVGGNGTLWHKRWTTAGGWTSWQDSGGGQVQWTPALTSRGGTTLDAFAVNTSEQVLHRYFNGTSWSAWINLGGSATAPPAAVALGNDRLNVLMRDGNGTLASKMWTSSNGWYDWVDRGEKIFGQPAASHRSDQLMDVFVRDDADKSLMHSASTNAGTSYSAFADLGGTGASAPATVSWADNRIDVFVRGTNGHLYQRIWTAGHGWYNFVDIGAVG